MIRKTVGAIAEAQAEVDKYKVVKREVKQLQGQTAANEQARGGLGGRAAVSHARGAPPHHLKRPCGLLARRRRSGS